MDALVGGQLLAPIVMKNFHDPPPDWTQDPDWASPLTVSEVGLSPVQTHWAMPVVSALQDADG